jgi:hypothetical protein
MNTALPLTDLRIRSNAAGIRRASMPVRVVISGAIGPSSEGRSTF